MKYTPPPFFFSERSLFLSARWTENPTGCTDSDSISRESHVFVKQSMLQSLMSLWKEIFALSMSTLLSRAWALASNIFGSSGWCAHLLSRTRSPLQIQPLESVQLSWGVRTKDTFGKVVFLVVFLVMLVSYLRSDIQKLFPAVCNSTTTAKTSWANNVRNNT